LVDLLVNSKNEVMGAIFLNKNKGLFVVFASCTIIATGGACQIYRETTNVTGNTGDGIAAAFRKKAVLSDMEFIQFHPTCLYIAGAPRILISETVRGEGAKLRNVFHEEFVKKYHPAGELAPRDELSRIISWEMEKTHSSYVLLDLSNLDEKFIMERFPTLYNTVKMFNIDIKNSSIPVRPAAHYFIGGIKIDEFCRTNVERLYAIGEASCSGFHGANRLGSNSLLECLVHGKIVSDYINQNFSPVKLEKNIKYSVKSKPLSIDFIDVLNSLKSLLTRNVGILRNETLLKEASSKLYDWMNYILLCEFNSQLGIELQNMLTVAYLVINSALKRTRSIGVHYRTDEDKNDMFDSRQHIDVAINI
ncbi:MAG: L-aspartate oxidase, partial [Planctomycetota bacterium]